MKDQDAATGWARFRLSAVCHGLLLVMGVFLLSIAAPLSTEAACTAPSGNAGAIVYNQTQKTFQYCNNTNWIEMNAKPGSGTGGCTTSTMGTIAEGRMFYNADSRVLQGCAGNVHRAMGPVGGGVKWRQVASGASHSCGIKNNGTLWCWGDDISGQIGNGAATGNQVIPAQESTAAVNWATVSAGYNFTCAVKTNGTLWCWGSDTYGQIGNGATTGNQISPVQESTAATNWVSVNASYLHACAIKTNGELWCWGSDSNGQIGNGATTGDQVSPVQESTAAVNWASVSTGYYYTCALKTNGTLWCWGSDSNGQVGNGATTGDQVSPVQESSVATNWVIVNTGAYHACAVKTTGTLWCWGTDGLGQVGNGATTGNQVSPVQESTAANNWVNVSAGQNHSCAVKTTGELWCWGSDSNGQIGNGTTTGNQVSPVQESTAAVNWANASAGSTHTCALKSSGTLLCWGSDTYGELGNGDRTGSQASPVEESTAATNWANVSVGTSHSCAIKSNGGLWCWGLDSSGQIGNGATLGNQPNPVQESTAANDWANISAGAYHTCAVKTAGTLWCWGSDGLGQIGNGAIATDQSSPVQEATAATNWANVSAGQNHTCAIKANGELWCWGFDSNGQIGNGVTTGNQVSPVQESTATTNWAYVSAGQSHTCAVKTNGELWCWGSDGNGQIGNGATTGDQVSPVQESTVATNWASVSAGASHTCAVKTTGTLWCWGSDGNGQIGNGATTVDQVSPVQESTVATNWASVSAGASHTCAVKSTGTLWCWGSDLYGQIGNGATTGNQVSPVQINAGSFSVDVGVDSTCAISSGKISCWGSNLYGQLGAGIPLGDSPVISDVCSSSGGQDKRAGAIVFNSAVNLLQYCDGAGWVGLGK